MNIIYLLLIGLGVGWFASYFVPSDNENQNIIVDMILGMLGTLFTTLFLAQFMKINLPTIVLIVIGAIVFIQIGRSLPDPN